ncbi:MAG: hypothetical protein JSS86_20380 [Cyanobacteria bacterium SZAS LIN-2]|nr:hypothetical protein [Cyanobacteria bacterium SZAS LIN-2]
MAKSNLGDYKSLAKRAEEAAMDDDREEKRQEKKRLRAAERRARAAAIRAEDDGLNPDIGLNDSQFDASTYQDTDFSRHSFIDLLVKSGRQQQDKTLTPDSDAASGELFRKDGRMSDSEDDRMHKHADGDDGGENGRTDKDSSVSLHQDLRREKKKHFDELQEVLQPPVPPGPNNWVPDKLDPIDNGGFECSPDNGSPVPYRLNGHVDIERGRPWKDSD